MVGYRFFSFRKGGWLFYDFLRLFTYITSWAISESAIEWSNMGIPPFPFMMVFAILRLSITLIWRSAAFT
jgi:hypothetical protein